MTQSKLKAFDTLCLSRGVYCDCPQLELAIDLYNNKYYLIDVMILYCSADRGSSSPTADQSTNIASANALCVNISEYMSSIVICWCVEFSVRSLVI